MAFRPRLDTLLAQAGLGGEGEEFGAVVPPLHLSTIYRLDHSGVFEYARTANPTRQRLETVLAALDGGREAVTFASGIAAIAAVVEAVAPVGGVVVGPRPGYSGTRGLLEALAKERSLECRLVDVADTAAVLEAMRGAHLCLVEAITNPTLDVPDLEALAAATRRQGVRLCVDATFATPVLCRPLEIGADVVVHSLSKYAGGHSDLIAGVAVVDDEDLARRLRRRQVAHGAILGQLECWLCLRGLRTLSVRLERQMTSAAILADRLASHPAVERVRYPGLASHPHHERARQLFGGRYGAVVAIELRGGADAADRLCNAVRVWTHATSLGGVESTLERRARYPEEQGIVAENLVRLSVGIEDVDDLWEDLASGLAEGMAAV